SIDIPILQISPEVEKVQKEKLAELKASRNQIAVDECLNEIDDAAKNGKNLMPIFIKAAENYVTLGEMVAVLKEPFGIYEETVVF
ncbi:MAG: methylmalonyl-CoA mutase, partial [Ignavibacteriales bacterium]|nr:methylmalonyl-CoA mutase [Ignavibacteriales bacterium]